MIEMRLSGLVCSLKGLTTHASRLTIFAVAQYCTAEGENAAAVMTHDE